MVELEEVEGVTGITLEAPAGEGQGGSTGFSELSLEMPVLEDEKPAEAAPPLPPLEPPAAEAAPAEAAPAEAAPPLPPLEPPAAEAAPAEAAPVMPPAPPLPPLEPPAAEAAPAEAAPAMPPTPPPPVLKVSPPPPPSPARVAPLLRPPGAPAPVIDLPKYKESIAAAHLPNGNQPSVQMLRDVKLLQPFTEQELSRLISLGSVVAYEAHANIVIEGELSWGIYFIISGVVGIFKTNKLSGDLYDVGQLRVGSFFGEMSLVDDNPRSATVRANVDCQLFYISKDAFLNFVGSSGDIRLRFYESCIQNLVHRLRELDDNYVISQYQLWKVALKREAV